MFLSVGLPVENQAGPKDRMLKGWLSQASCASVSLGRGKLPEPLSTLPL